MLHFFYVHLALLPNGLSMCGDINAIMGDQATTDIALNIHVIRSIYDSLVEAPKSIHGANKSSVAIFFFASHLHKMEA